MFNCLYFCNSIVPHCDFFLFCITINDIVIVFLVWIGFTCTVCECCVWVLCVVGRFDWYYGFLFWLASSCLHLRFPYYFVGVLFTGVCCLITDLFPVYCTLCSLIFV